MTQLGKLQKVDLRSVWKHEATDFSAWLVQPENLDVLAEQLGLRNLTNRLKLATLMV